MITTFLAVHIITKHQHRVKDWNNEVQYSGRRENYLSLKVLKKKKSKTSLEKDKQLQSSQSSNFPLLIAVIAEIPQGKYD